MSQADDDAPSPNEELVAEALEVLEVEGAEAFEALLARHPARADAVRRRVQWLADTGFARAAPPVKPAPKRLGDFELLEPLGQGGMGVVYRALQVSLGREVALKLVRPEELYFPGQRERFRREVAVVAALAHPGIVPIYAVGEENGLPYFAMERIRGASLGQVLDVLAGKPARERTGADLLKALAQLGADAEGDASSLFEGEWPRVCVRLAREVAEALEHAHRRGVLHRDVKPSNVMVTRGGRVMLLDFGLAGDVGSAIEPLNQRLTRTGLRVGTLAYMSPEQLRGERALDARSDVFSLGVALYELLSARLPLDASSQARRVDAAGLGVPMDLRKQDARISRELETVVQTATALDPKRRYASAAEFARDLTNLLENRPIDARRASAWRRTALWVRRHPAWTVAGVLLVATPSLVAWRETLARAEIADKNAVIEQNANALSAALADVTAQRDATDAARGRAERNLERAFEAVDRMLSRIGGEALVDTPRSHALRKALLEDALDLQDELLADSPTTPEQARASAKTLHRSAAIHGELGRYQEALDLLEREQQLLDVAMEAGADRALVVERAEIDRRRAELFKLRGELATAETHGLAAIRRLEELPRLDGGDAVRARSLAYARIELADILTRGGDGERRTKLLVAAVEDLEALTAASPQSWDLRMELARALQTLGATAHSLQGMESRARDPREDSRWLGRALELYRELDVERPDNPAVAFRVAQCSDQLAFRRMQLRDIEGAASGFDDAISGFEGLTRDFPARATYFDGIASSSYNRGLIAALQQDRATRAQMFLRSIGGYERAIELSAESGSAKRGLALACAQLGETLSANELERDAAIASFERALEVGRPLLDFDGDGSLRRALAWASSRLAGVQLAVGDYAGCARSGDGLAQLDSQPLDLVWGAGWLARAQAAARGAEASHIDASTCDAWREQALALLERVVAEHANDPRVRKELADESFASLADDARFRALLGD